MTNGAPVSPADSGLPAKKRARELLLETAARLFYAQGVRATGIDAITAQAGVAKKSLYNNFTSKQELVAAYLEARHDEWLGLYHARVDNTAGPRERVLAVFDACIDHANFAYEHGFRGCGLLNAASELPAGSPGRLAVRRHKEEVEALLAGHVDELLPQQDERLRGLGAHLAFVLEGAMVRAGLEGGDARLLEGRRIAAQLLDGL
jgi:AcrR family transcriptional regulator